MGSGIPSWGGEIRRVESDLGWGPEGGMLERMPMWAVPTFPELPPAGCLLPTHLTREKPRLSHRVTQI